MRSKKWIIGAAVMVLAVSSGAVVYASIPRNDGPLHGLEYQETVSSGGEGGLSLNGADKNELPEGVLYQGRISSEGGMRFGGLDAAELPDGVQARDRISIDPTDMEGAFSLDETDKENLPEGIFYQDDISIDAADGIPLK